MFDFDGLETAEANVNAEPLGASEETLLVPPDGAAPQTTSKNDQSSTDAAGFGDAALDVWLGRLWADREPGSGAAASAAILASSVQAAPLPGPERSCGLGAATRAPEPSAAERHVRAAEVFAEMLLQMRVQSPHGSAYLAGLHRVFRALPACQRASPYGERAEQNATARCLLATLVRDSETLCDAAGPAPEEQREAFLEVTTRAEEEILQASGPLDHLSEAGGDWMQEAVPIDPDMAGAQPQLTLFQRFVHLPLVMYVRNTVHLYETLERLKAQFEGCWQRKAGQLRRLLDGEGTRTESPYSWLVYGIIGALQTLHRVRQRMGTAHFPLELLASSPPRTVWEEGLGAGWRRQLCNNCEAMLPAGSLHQAGGLMYRGIWLPSCFSKEQERYQYSFQSFSRNIHGVMRVLRFYSSVSNTRAHTAATSGRLLLYVARGWTASPWVVPVQLFDGPKKVSSDSEEELLLPPFIVYDFEEEFSIDPEMEPGEKGWKLDAVQENWGLELPPKLVNFVHGSLTHLNHTLVESVKAGVSVRFLRDASPAPPMARLFTDEGQYLYAWRLGAVSDSN